MCREIVRNGYLKEHLESNHLGMKYSCHECELEARSKQQLRRHVEKMHLGITYRCDECDYQTRAKEDLGVHVKVKHLDSSTHVMNAIIKPLQDRVLHCILK